ncbi:MAG: hypothetical protein QG559_186 [Campylobacterota bacterium]|nr:hypothetical protein [Campylobacterota bacterium]
MSVLQLLIAKQKRVLKFELPYRQNWIDICFEERMIKYIFIISAFLLFSGCMNKHGISAKYYSECEEYYDMQGYYHKKCGDDDIITYEELGKKTKEVLNSMISPEFKEEKPQGPVW